MGNCKIPTSSRYPTKFQKGDKAECIDARDSEGRLSPGRAYDVVMAVANKKGFEFIYLETDDMGGQHLSFAAKRFRKVRM